MVTSGGGREWALKTSRSREGDIFNKTSLKYNWS